MTRNGLRITIVGLSVAGIGGVVIASARRSEWRRSAALASPGLAATSAASGGSSVNAGSPPSPTVTVRKGMARVAGAAEIILVNNQGLPLYIFSPDTATESMVIGELAALWTPLLADVLTTESGTGGVVAIVRTANGQHVTYNGHFLYTFAKDSPHHVTGGGLQNFLVATPGLVSKHAAAAPGTAGKTPTGSRLSDGR